MEESTQFRLLAPDGVYNVKVTDGKNTISQDGVALTGNAIGILDERLTGTNPLTSTINSGQDNTNNSTAINKNSTLIYLFLVVIAGAAILLAVERRFRKKVWGEAV